MGSIYRCTVLKLSNVNGCFITVIQWNPSITDTFGELAFIHAEVAFVERLFCTQTVHLGPGCLAFI